MIILSKGSLTQTGRFAPETMALNLSERGSTATITFGIGEANLAIGDWLQDDTEPGEGIVWRVKTIDTQYNTHTVTVQLEDMVNSLNDQLLNGEIKPSDIAGGSATTCTARQAVEYILARQSVWTLDDFDYDSVSNPYNFNGDALKAALDTVSSSLEDPVWSYDFTSYPFKISITHLSDDIDSEMRMDRNISTLKVSIDRTRMYTRFYPIGKNNLRLDAPGYAEKNVGTYGLIEKTETDETKDTKAKLAAWAQECLDKHAEPLVTATVAGLDLSARTGISLDSFTIGKKCRMPLPEFYTTITEKVTKLSWRDKLAEPENVTVTMANQKEDIASIINRINSNGGKSGRAKAKDGEEDHAWIVDTTDHVSLIAEAVAGKDGEGNPDWSRVAELTVDGNGIDARVTETEGGLVTLSSAIVETSTQIFITVENAKSDLTSYIDVTAEGIEIAASAASSTMYSVIETTATNIRTEVSRRAKVFIQINDPALELETRPTLREGDIWIKASRVRSWDEMGSRNWDDASSLDWNKYNGAEQFVWDGINNRWEPVSDKGLMGEWGTRIEQTENSIRLLAQAVGAIDPEALAQASIDISADAITLAVSTAKSEIYSIIKQTASNITQEVVNNIEGVASYIEQTASSITQAVARKNKVFVQMTDPANNNTVIDGDIWIKSSANDNIHPSWSELSAKTWSSQNTTNWREYYEGYWYVRKNNAWQRMNQDADIVEIGTKLEQDERHIALVARDVDRNHVELGSRLQVTATQIRSEVHAAKSTLYSAIVQTSTSIVQTVTSVTDGLSSSITQTKSRIALVVTQKDGRDVIDSASIVAGINAQTGSYVKISASTINLSGYVKATDITADLIKAKIELIGTLAVGYVSVGSGKGIRFNGSSGTYAEISYASLIGVVKDMRITQSGNTYTLQKKNYIGGANDWVDVGSFSRAVSSWLWAGGNGKIQVTALPQDQSKVISVSIDGQNTITSNGTYTYTVDYENADGDDVSTGATKDVTVSVGTDKGSNWYCTIEQSGQNKTCRLVKNFGASQSVPFTNGNSYRLYTH